MHTSFWRDKRGQMAIIFSLTLPVLLSAVGIAVDYTAWTRQQAKLQGIADATAIAAARELYMANADISQVNTIANTFANAQLMGDTSNGAVSVLATVKDDASSDGERVAAVQVDVSQGRTAYFTGFVAGSMEPLGATAVARVLGGGRLCVIGLDKDASTTIELTQQAQVTATECAVYSNATSASGIDAGDMSQLAAELICSAGGTYGGSSNFSPEPLTDCPAIEDPLSDRPAPYYSGCDYTDFLVASDDDEVTRLYPGVYCGGIEIKDSRVEFRPGTYIIKDGPLKVVANAQVWGEHVGFYLTGDGAVYSFGSQSDVDFTAPRDGPLAGILFFEDRDAPEGRRHVISSKRADNLLGTIYLSRGVFVVSTTNKVAQDSAYTAVIANRIELSKKPNLYLNANYGATDIPVPNGIGPVGGNVYLER